MGTCISTARSLVPKRPKPVTAKEEKPDVIDKDGGTESHHWPKRDAFAFTGTVHHDTYPAIDPVTKSDCTGLAVLVTGSGRGIGKAMVISYAKAGASHIAICTRSDDTSVVGEVLEAASAAGRPQPNVLHLRLDVCDNEQILEAAKRVTVEWGRLDILINNSGFMGNDCAKRLDEASLDEYEHTLNVNLRGVIRVTKAFLPLILKSEHKTIVIVTSIGAIYVGHGIEAYSITKFAQCRFAEFLCHAYQKEGLLVYSIHPAGVRTELSERMPASFHPLLCDTPELGGDTLAFLTSHKRDWLASRFINCNWDMPELMAMEKEIVENELLKFKCQGLAF